MTVVLPHFAIGTRSGTALKLTHQQPSKAATLNGRVDPNPPQLNGLNADALQSATSDQPPIEGSDDELAPAIEVEGAHRPEILIPAIIAEQCVRVRHDDLMQNPNGVLIGIHKAAKLDHLTCLPG